MVVKFIVDELPFWEDDCPFFNFSDETCILDGHQCKYMSENIAGQRNPEDCEWLEERW